MKMLINKSLILESIADAVAARSAAFHAGGKLSDEEFNNIVNNGGVALKGETALGAAKNRGLQKATRGDIVDPTEAFHANRLLNTIPR